MKLLKLPRYNERYGWLGGDTRTLYAFTDPRTGTTIVRPGHPGDMRGIGPAVVRVATREEAERLWQTPLHTGWTVAA